MTSSMRSRGVSTAAGEIEPLELRDRVTRDTFRVACLRTNDFKWVLPADGVARSAVFPRLGIDHTTLATDDYAALFATLDAGTATPEPTAFVQQLKATKG